MRRHRSILAVLVVVTSSCAAPNDGAAPSPPAARDENSDVAPFLVVHATSSITPAAGEGEGEGEGEATAEDDARIVSVSMPDMVPCGATLSATIVVENTGLSTWTRAAEFKLGAVDDADPFNGAGRIYLDDGASIAPGRTATFTIPLTAPLQEGSYMTDWRMVHELVRWFGETSTANVAVACPRRTGIVHVDGRGIADDQGAFTALGASLFWGAWGYKFDRARLEQNLAYLATHGFDYVRVLGVVGDPNAADDYWQGREATTQWDDYDAVIAGFTDLAYQYGLRTEWTLMGGVDDVPTTEDRYALADRFLAMSAGREHEIAMFEVINEYWQNGYGGDEAGLRDITRYMKDRTDVLVAASAPTGDSCDAIEALYGDGDADVATFHFGRDISGADGAWGPVRRPWGFPYGCDTGGAVGSNNEPIGAGSSVNTETDPERLVAGALVTFASQLPFHVYHSRAGVRGDFDVWTMAGVDAFAHLHDLVPQDVANWERRDRDTGPFVVEGALDAYAGESGAAFFAVLVGIDGAADVEARRAMDFDVYEPTTGALLEHVSLEQGAHHSLSGASALVARGVFR